MNENGRKEQPPRKPRGKVVAIPETDEAFVAQLKELITPDDMAMVPEYLSHLRRLNASGQASSKKVAISDLKVTRKPTKKRGSL